MENRPTNIFERNKKKTIVIIVLVTVALITVLSELVLEKAYGLGNVILYESNPLYGFRPLPNQMIYRVRYWSRPFSFKLLKFNNLGLRADEDWDEKKDDKILFLGDSVAYGGSINDNKELFSHLAVLGLKNYKDGNAAVPAWGVENIYGLIVEANFIPAKIYVTTVPEADFYRGVTRIHGQPYYNVPPRFALLEVWQFFCFYQNVYRQKDWATGASYEEKHLVATRAVKKLKEMDEFLKSKGFVHLIFISPIKQQLLGSSNKDEIVHGLLKNYNLDYIDILDELKKYNLSEREKALLFYDDIHLEKKGHEMWAKIIRSKLNEVTK